MRNLHGSFVNLFTIQPCSVNAALACKDHERDKLERLCIYISPRLAALERLSIDGDRLVVYALKRPFRSRLHSLVLHMDVRTPRQAGCR